MASPPAHTVPCRHWAEAPGSSSIPKPDPMAQNASVLASAPASSTSPGSLVVTPPPQVTLFPLLIPYLKHILCGRWILPTQGTLKQAKVGLSWVATAHPLSEHHLFSA